MKLKNSIIHILKELGLVIGTLAFIILMALLITQVIPSGTWEMATGLLTILAVVLYIVGYT